MALLERHIRPQIVAALADTRVVVVLGARQVGKSTLVEEIARTDHPARVLTLDDQTIREAARSDPAGFVAGLEIPVVIDEVQRAPDVLLAIKRRVDEDATPGQFLLTGSANILTAPKIADALTGRAEYYRLQPFSHGELIGRRERFIPDLFDGIFPQVSDVPPGRDTYAGHIATGGYPEAVARADHRRWRFFESYVDTILQRDLTSLSGIHDAATVRRLLHALAAVSGSLVNLDGLSRDTGVPTSTLRSHTDLLETLFLVTRLEPWHHNLLSRVVRTPKAYITDTGLLSYLLGVNDKRIVDEGDIAGIMFETFVAMELQRQARAGEEVPDLFHYRDRDQREVDLVLERRDGSVVGVEVKAAASVKSSDFRGLRYLRDKLGPRFKAGVIIYTGEGTVTFSDRLAAVPLCGLWVP